MPYVNTYIDVCDVLDELSDDELIDELKRRGRDYNVFVDSDEMRMIFQTLYEKRRIGKDYQSELDQLIYSILGKIV
jgi:hypothetical protein